MVKKKEEKCDYCKAQQFPKCRHYRKGKTQRKRERKLNG